MALNAHSVLKLNKEIKELQTLNDGMIATKQKIEIWKNMTPIGYNLIDNVNKWVESQIVILETKRDKLTDINLV